MSDSRSELESSMHIRSVTAPNVTGRQSRTKAARQIHEKKSKHKYEGKYKYEKVRAETECLGGLARYLLAGRKLHRRHANVIWYLYGTDGVELYFPTEVCS